MYAYDGRDFIKFDKEIPAWVPLDPAAQNTKRKWEAEAIYVQRAKAYLEEECPGMLQRYLPYSRTHLDRQGARCRLYPASLAPPFPCAAGKDQGDRRWVPRGPSQADPAVPSPGDATAQLSHGEKASAAAAAAAAKSLQSCPTLCDPIDGSPPGSAVSGILQAGTLEWVAISFSSE